MAPVATFGLGTWQVKRKMWKENLIREMEKKLNLEAEPLPENLEDLNNMEYQNIVVKGQFIHDRELLLGPRGLISPKAADNHQGGGLFTSQSASSGFQIITPFKLDGREETILVNRGWVARDKKNPNTRRQGQVEGIVEIQGIVRLEEARPQFTPEHRGNSLFFYRDLFKMSSMTNSEPYFIDIKYDPSLPAEAPIGGQTRVALRNEHLSYIITWYSISAFTGFLWWKKVIQKVPF